MTNNIDKIIVVFLSILLILELIQQVALENTMLLLNIFKILKISSWTFWKKNLHISCLVDSFFLKFS